MKDVRPLDLERIKKIWYRAGKAPRTVQYVLAVIRQITIMQLIITFMMEPILPQSQETKV